MGFFFFTLLFIYLPHFFLSSQVRIDVELVFNSSQTYTTYLSRNTSSSSSHSPTVISADISVLMFYTITVVPVVADTSYLANACTI